MFFRIKLNGNQTMKKKKCSLPHFSTAWKMPHTKNRLSFSQMILFQNLQGPPVPKYHHIDAHGMGRPNWVWNAIYLWSP